MLAIAISAHDPQEPGQVVLYATGLAAGDPPLHRFRVGAVPDMVAFAPDTCKILVANEGEPSDDYVQDPEGSVSIIDFAGGLSNASITTATFAECQ